MKKIMVVSLALLALVGCGGGDSKEKKTESTEKKESGSELSDNPDYQKGLTLIANSDCLTCHRPTERVQGPSYQEVANKYASAGDTIISHLAQKVIRGGNDGVWNMAGSMTPHPSLSEDDAKVGSSRVDLQACKLEYSIVSPK